MAAELPRPGVEVIQEFQSTSPTIVTPTLVPCVVAPFFEVVEVLNADSTVNEDSKLDDSYSQLALTVPQSSFPDARGNIDEVNIEEDSIRCFFNFAGSLQELSRTSGFLTRYDVGTAATVESPSTEPVGGFDIDGLTLVVALDSHTAVANGANTPGLADFPVSANVTITFEAATPGGTLTLEEVVAQINATIPGLASENDAGTNLVLTSRRYGARSSIAVRITSSALVGNDELAASGLGWDAGEDTVAVGSGFYAINDADGDLTSPRLEVFTGAAERLMSEVNVAVTTAPDFVATFVEPGDTVYADGVNVGNVLSVEADRLTMEVEQNLMSHGLPFAPRYVWLQANDLAYPAPASSTAATQTGTVQTEAATQAYIVGATAFAAVSAAQTMDVDVTVDGVAQATVTVASGTGWAAPSNAVSDINAAADLADTGGSGWFQAYEANEAGDEQTGGGYLALRTVATGSAQSITLSAQTVGMETAGLVTASSDIGENNRYLPGTRPTLETVGAAGISTGGGIDITVTHVTLGAQGVENIIFSGGNTTLQDVIDDINTQSSWAEAYDAGSSRLGIRTRGENFGAGSVLTVANNASAPALDAGGDIFGTDNGADTPINGQSFTWSLDLNPKQYSVNLTTDEDDGGTSLQQVIDRINEETPGVASESDTSPPALKLTSKRVGEASEVVVYALQADGVTPIPDMANDSLGFSDTANTTATGAGRPVPDLVVDVSGNALIQSQILRSGLTGIPFNPGLAPIHFAFKALRLDVSPDADDPGLLVLDSVDVLQQVANPISTDNPGALMAFLMMLNTPGSSVTAVGVSETSADAPDGTPIGYAKCADFLEAEEVYALAVASQNPVVHQTFLTHVNFMSEPEQKGERILFFNPVEPDRANPTLVGSGTDINSTAQTHVYTVEENVAPGLIDQGLDPDNLNPTSGPIENEVYLDLGGDDLAYLVVKVENGVDVHVRKDFVSGDGNEDAFYAIDFPGTVISDDWAIKVRGAPLTIPGSTLPDFNAIAETVQGAASAYGFRRGFYVFPDQCGINVTGLEQLVEGYYATAAVGGMVAGLPPQQGFTNYPITGLTRVVGSNDRFTERQLNVMAAGGTYILVQDVEGAPVICRHQLSTDLSSIETRELSITKVVDYCAKFIRGGLRSFIGRNNITQAFLDQLSSVIQGMLSFLTETGALIGADLNNLIQDADAPDTVLVDITLDVPFPANYIRVTLII